ncbi:hypothetical protein IFM89_029796 [Coptis chinensis]|uniref:TFIID subunit TAF5 NTD2 domain-containing protein n=1 Tax=Coptis chinensis TaxID=261450 RepID=A0A835IG29_9MAGN|nr:hypothetical protein IFM89_029796 [Coptis chinensis]
MEKKWEEEDIEKYVVKYLKSKGLRQTEMTYHEEQSRNPSSSSTTLTDPDIARHLLSFAESENSPARYQEGYSKLRSWTYTSLDLYKHELLRVLYPVFIHCFMDLVAKGYGQEARTFFNSFREDHELMHLRDLQKLEGQMEFAHSLRQSKVNIKICQYSYELLLQYLHKTQSITMLGIINEHINFQVSPGQPISISDDAGAVILVGSSQDTAKQINEKEIRWDSIEDRLEKASSLMSDSEKTEGEFKEGDVDENKKRSGDGGKQGTSVKKLKKDKIVGTTGKSVRSETNTVSMAPRVKPELTLPVFLNCSSISQDGSLVAGGFSDSSLKVWDMAKIGQVMRLWSTKLNLILFCYKGHNYPVWDVQFSPMGHYFASSSHDRTARIWSMDRIQPLRIMAGHLSDVDCVRWHANCNYIATGSSDKTVRLWDVQSGECVRIFIGHRSMILSLAMSPDGRYMASGDEEGTIMMWDLSSGRCITPLMGHTSCVWTLDFSGEGSLLASGSADCTVKLWDVTASTKAPKIDEKAGCTNRLRSLKTLPTKCSPVYTVQFSRRNLLFAAGVLSRSS